MLVLLLLLVPLPVFVFALLLITQEIGPKFPLLHKKSSEVTDQGAETKLAAALRDLYRMRWNKTEELDTTTPVTLTHTHSRLS